MTDESNSNAKKELLRLESSNTSLLLWKCPYFCQIEDVSIAEVSPSKYFSLRCEQCSCIWYVCFNCGLQNKHYYTSYFMVVWCHMYCVIMDINSVQNVLIHMIFLSWLCVLKMSTLTNMCLIHMLIYHIPNMM